MWGMLLRYWEKVYGFDRIYVRNVISRRSRAKCHPNQRRNDQRGEPDRAR